MSPAVRGARARVRRLLGRLPAPWDERALTLARSLKGRAKGTPVSGPSRHEQWVRDVVEQPAAGPQWDPEGIDPAERAAVRAGWQLVDTYERLSTAGADRVFGHELRAWYGYANDTVPNLKPWGNPGKLKLYERDHNRLRFRRTMDFVRTGERIFDVGFGRGYLAGLLLQERKLAGYHGIDIVPANLTAIQQMVAANGLGSAEVGVTLGDIYELTREQVEATGAGLLVCCEVLEHVPDAELALRTLADALPDGVDLLFSVPLYGRLEHVWGHVSVFDAARLKAMLHGAGLIAHHVEPLANLWSFVVASKSGEPSPRVREATGRSGATVSRPLSARYDFVDVPATDFAVGPIARGASCVVEPTSEDGVSCAVSAPAKTRAAGPQASVTFPVQGVESLRLMFRFVEFAEVGQVRVRALDGANVVAEWNWVPKQRQISAGGLRRFALRPGESTSMFEAGQLDDVSNADRVQLELNVRPGKSARFVLRAAYLPTRG